MVVGCLVFHDAFQRRVVTQDDICVSLSRYCRVQQSGLWIMTRVLRRIVLENSNAQ